MIETTATELTVDTYNTMFTNFPALTQIGVWVDGVFDSSLAPGATGAESFDLEFSAGQKTIEIVAGPTSRPAAAVLGTFVQSVTGNAALTEVNDVAAERLLIYGDSITVGDGCGETVQEDAWAVLVRQSFSGSVALEAWGSRSLHEDCNTSGLRAEFVAKVAKRNPTILWLAIGTNDYGLDDTWSAADFGTAYAALLDDLHTALPGAAIYAQTPILRSSEPENAFGDTLGEYRTAISNACTGRAWVTLVDGSAFLTTDDLADGTHPNVTGHGKIATAVLAALA